MNIEYVDDARITCVCGEKMPVILRAQLDAPVVEYVATCDKCGLVVKCDAYMKTSDAMEVLERIVDLERDF